MPATSLNGQQPSVAPGVGMTPQERAQRTLLWERLLRALRSEPWWLRGVSWGLVGMVGMIALIEVSALFLSWLRSPTNPAESGWAEAFADLTFHMLAALSILLVSAVLVNLRRPRVPVPLALGVGVMLGCLSFAGSIYLMLVLLSPHSLNWHTHHFIMAETRRLAVVWGSAAVAWYFLHRSVARQSALRAA